jgi:Uncharacterized alpha/beta hydrolase domain (DUF2235)
MALYAFDGTWNTPKDGDDPAYKNTNVVRFSDAYRRHSGTSDFYVAGVGTRFGAVGRAIGGVFGAGELARIDEAYDHLCTAWSAGDRVIDIVGFSRGAATTLDFCHCIQTRGIRRPGTDLVVEANPRIRFLGVWDVVAAFGLANLGATELNIGHHLSLPKSSLQYCFHAMALDERRPSFLPTRLQGACEVWFRGVHSDVGGGNANRGLNDVSMTWMMRKARAAGLPITDDDISALRPDPTTRPHGDHDLPVSVRLIAAVDRGHHTVTPLKGFTSLPETCSIETLADEDRATELSADTLEVLPLAVRRRIAALWEAAEAAGKELDFSLAGVQDALLTLFQGRAPLITNDDELNRGRAAAVRLVGSMVDGAQRRSFHHLTDFFLNEALFNLRPLFPFTD